MFAVGAPVDGVAVVVADAEGVDAVAEEDGAGTLWGGLNDLGAAHIGVDHSQLLSDLSSSSTKAYTWSLDMDVQLGCDLVGMAGPM